MSVFYSRENIVNYGIILAAGVGQRMRNGGLPKQFLKLMGKPIIIYTLEKFNQCNDIDKIIVVCHGSYIDYMKNLVNAYQIYKVESIIVGGNDRQGSLQRGLEGVINIGGNDEDIVIIHDGVRPLVSNMTICENIRIAKQFGCAVTVHSVTETVVVTDSETANKDAFKKRDDTYSMTSPQSFHLGKINEAYSKIKYSSKNEIPLLDAAMVYAQNGGEVHLVKEHGTNIKITTPEDYYILKAMIELEETKYVFGL
jgi:2-C-methyl-D-erythritol 4-phosphate cytidylyltransferase